MEWQQSCKRRREDKRINEQIDKWDEVMKPIGEPPKGFRDWYQHNGFDGSNFYFTIKVPVRRPGTAHLA